MGDIADMMLEGLLDMETGEYIGEQNKGIYGTEAPGFPITYEKEECSVCGKRVKPGGLYNHMKDKHGIRGT